MAPPCGARCLAPNAPIVLASSGRPSCGGGEVFKWRTGQVGLFLKALDYCQSKLMHQAKHLVLVLGVLVDRLDG